MKFFLNAVSDKSLVRPLFLVPLCQFIQGPGQFSAHHSSGACIIKPLAVVISSILFIIKKLVDITRSESYLVFQSN